MRRRFLLLFFPTRCIPKKNLEPLNLWPPSGKYLSMRSSALIYLNGKRVEVPAQHARMMLADYLRYQAGLTGTKIVCAEGDCGACTVLRAFAGFTKGQPEYLPINSCI